MHSCIHLTLVSYDLKSSKRLDVISIWFFDEFSSLYLRFLNIKPISYLTMICYHQNPIRRTLGLTISPFLMMTNLDYLGEKEISPSNQSWINQTISNVKHEKSMDKNIISYCRPPFRHGSLFFFSICFCRPHFSHVSHP